jgi:hypothetical protein
VCLGWGCTPGDGGVGPYVVCVPGCFTVGMSPSPLSRILTVDWWEGGCKRFHPSTYTNFLSILYRLCHLFYTSLFSFFSRKACLLASPFLSPFLSYQEQLIYLSSFHFPLSMVWLSNYVTCLFYGQPRTSLASSFGISWRLIYALHFSFLFVWINCFETSYFELKGIVIKFSTSVFSWIKSTWSPNL